MDRTDGALLTDLYELTMLQAYFDEGMDGNAVFEFFVRDLPAQRRFLLAAGLEQALDYLAGLRFAAPDLAWIRGTKRFAEPFIAWLGDLRFGGDVDALPEGTAFFANEPVLRISAPLPQAQFVESRVMNLLHFQTMVASKAARVVIAAAGRPLVDFGLRRAHGAEAALLSARASYIAGFEGTATALAAREYGIPVFGTMAHSFVQAHDSEQAAFAAFARAFPANATLLVDTYDTEAAALLAAELAQRLREAGSARIQAVRLDSGDLAALAARVRAILDRHGCQDTGIFASGNLDEHAVAALVASGAPVNAFGVGTRMNTSADAPYLDCAYKLVEYAGEPRRKRSAAKETWPGRKQVYRRYGPAGHIESDVIGLEDEALPGQPLLEPVMRGGVRIRPPPSLAHIRQRARDAIGTLAPALRELGEGPALVPEVSAGVRALAARADARQAAAARTGPPAHRAQNTQAR